MNLPPLTEDDYREAVRVYGAACGGPQPSHVRGIRAAADIIHARLNERAEPEYRPIDLADVRKGMTLRTVAGDITREGVACHLLRGDWHTAEGRRLTYGDQSTITTPDPEPEPTPAERLAKELNDRFAVSDGPRWTEQEAQELLDAAGLELTERDDRA